VLDGIFQTFHFREFGKCSAVKVQKFFGKKRNFWTRKIFAKRFVKSSELFVFATFGNFSEKNGIFKLAKIFAKKFGYYSKMYVNFKNFEKTMHSLSFLVKKPCFWVKKFGKSLGKFGKVRKHGFLNIRKLLYSELSKIMKKWC